MGFFFDDDNSNHLQVMESNKIVLALLITILVIKFIEIVIFFTRSFKKTVVEVRI